MPALRPIIPKIMLVLSSAYYSKIMPAYWAPAYWLGIDWRHWCTPPSTSSLTEERMLTEAFYGSLLSSAPDTRSRALALSSSIPHAGDWLNVVPSSTLGLHLHDREFRLCVDYWLGLKMSDEESRCPLCAGKRVADPLEITRWTAGEWRPDPQTRQFKGLPLLCCSICRSSTTKGGPIPRSRDKQPSCGCLPP